MPKQELKAAYLLLVYAMLIAGSYTLMRTVGDSLFLSRVGSDGLAVVFVASGISTSLIATLWFALTRRLRLAVAIRVSGLLFAALTLAAWAALPHLHHSWLLLASIYLLTEIKGCVNAINFVTAMNDILGGHSSRQAWAKIGLGAPLAGLIVGVILGLEASFLNLRTWLLFSALLDLLALMPLSNVAAIRVPRPTRRRVSNKSMLTTANRLNDKLKRYANSRQFRFWIGVLTGAKVVVLTMVAFFWKVSVNEYFDGNEQSLTRYFGVFYASVGLLTLLIQWFVTGRLISGRSLHVPILVMPIALTGLAVVFLLCSSALLLVILATLAKSLEIWRRSVHDTTLNLLYTKIERTKRRSAIAFNTALVKPLAEVGASLGLLLGTAIWYKSVMLIGLAVWILATFTLLRLVARTKFGDPSVRSGLPADDDNSDVKQFASGLFHN